jgi:hypothetical protein
MPTYQNWDEICEDATAPRKTVRLVAAKVLRNCYPALRNKWNFEISCKMQLSSFLKQKKEICALLQQ